MLRDSPSPPAEVGAPTLAVTFDAPLPGEVSIGAGTAIFVCGWCFAPEAEIGNLSLRVDGQRQPVMAQAMPRLDPFAELHPTLDPYATSGLKHDPDSASDPQLRSYRSGFWGLARVAPTAAGRERIELELEAELADGRTVRTPLASIAVTPAVSPIELSGLDVATGEEPLVAVCMATHDPPLDLFERQLESIRAQTHRRWICLISDDCSTPERFAALQRLVAGDPRFVVSRSAVRRDFYGNFERALAMVPAEAEFVALADQDDDWHPDKLSTLLAAIGGAQLAYSDARIVDRSGTVLSETYWSRRRNNHSDMLSLLVANSVSGSATLLRREVLDDALPFPPAQFAHYHDHWLAVVALARGRIAFVDRPLYDYVQHGQAALGHAAANLMPTLRQRLRSRGDRAARVRLWRMHYFVDACRLLALIAILELRLGDRLTGAKRRSLGRLAGAERSPRSLLRLACRGARELTGRPETLGAEWTLFRAFSWRRLVAATARDRPQRHLRLDAVPPSDLAPRAGRPASASPVVSGLAAKVAPLQLSVSADVPARVNLLLPTIDLDHFFGGYIAKFNLAHRLAETGVRVRIVTVDPVGRLPHSWPRTVESYAGLSGLFDNVEVAFGREQAPLAVSPDDRFIATTWWTAHIADAATRVVSGERFVYLIQEYEPFTFPMGTYAALAEASYRFEHFALFSSELLREYFERHRIGVFADGRAGSELSAAFENAITPVTAPTAAELAARDSRRLLFYARPEPHAARNLFELGVLALSQAVESGRLPSGWECHGIGSVSTGPSIALGPEVDLRLTPRTDQAGYARTLRENDVGLALMYTPHPSLVPIEMAAAGLVTVTNTFENKTASALAQISANLLAVEPTVDALAAAIGDAVTRSSDHDQRARASAVGWSRDWTQSFDDALLARILGALGMAP